MGKILAIGDTHGRKDWQIFKEQDMSQVGRIIFIGDYFDTHDDITQFEQLHNFKQILEFKKQYPDKVILLIGNHDFHYMGDFKMKYSGFEPALAFDIRLELLSALKDDLIQMSHHEYSNGIDILFTHAGVTKTWADNNLPDYNEGSLATCINELFKYKPNSFEFTPSEKYNMYGDETSQTPIWVRPKSLMSDPVFPDMVQVVGHTQHDKITQVGRFVFIDCLANCPNEFLSGLTGEELEVKI